MRTRLGRYFEILTGGIYGGKIRQIHESNGENNSDMVSVPDITYNKKNCLREVKAVSLGGSLKLIDEQISRYVILQTEDYVLKDPIIRFEIFRHGVKKLVSEFDNKNLEELVKAISGSIRFMVSLPFSVIYELYRADPNWCNLVSRYDGERYDTLTRFLSSGLNKIIAESEETIKKIGLDISDFEIEKRKFPKGVKMNNIEINQFPVILVRDKDHMSWLEYFKGRVKEEIELEKQKKAEAIEIAKKEMVELENIYMPCPLFGRIVEFKGEAEKGKEKVPFDIPDIEEDYDLANEGWSGDDFEEDFDEF